jgi:hypothetical protein
MSTEPTALCPDEGNACGGAQAKRSGCGRGIGRSLAEYQAGDDRHATVQAMSPRLGRLPGGAR